LSIVVRYINIIWFKKNSLKVISLPSVFLYCVVCFPFAMITYSVRAVVVEVSEAPLEVEEPSFRSEGDLGSCYK